MYNYYYCTGHCPERSYSVFLYYSPHSVVYDIILCMDWPRSYLFCPCAYLPNIQKQASKRKTLEIRNSWHYISCQCLMTVLLLICIIPRFSWTWFSGGGSRCTSSSNNNTTDAVWEERKWSIEASLCCSFRWVSMEVEQSGVESLL